MRLSTMDNRKPSAFVGSPERESVFYKAPVLTDGSHSALPLCNDIDNASSMSGF